VLDGVEGGDDGVAGRVAPRSPEPERPRRRRLDLADYVKGVRAADRTVLGRAITLIESNAPAHQELGRALLRELLPHTGTALRVGVTGMPGAGKSTFIDTLGDLLCERGHRLAVLAVDPSSTRTRGSILGDKTRMDRLSRRPGAFIRPSPTGGTLGGVTRKSRETMLVCEAAGYDVILIETVGVGQSEVAVRAMVDFFLLMLLPGAGDELQGLKRGVMELCDTLVVNKADGDNRVRAEATRAEYARAIHLLQPATEGWTTRVLACSALTGAGVPEVWDAMQEFRELALRSGALEERRRSQLVDWVRVLAREYLERRFFDHPRVRVLLPELETAVARGELPATRAVELLIEAFEKPHG
jgi:LAO/AO transport system kinase